MALIAVLVESDECAEGERGCLESDDEHQEVTARNHEVHAEQCEKYQFIELAAAHGGKLRVRPFD